MVKPKPRRITIRKRVKKRMPRPDPHVIRCDEFTAAVNSKNTDDFVLCIRDIERCMGERGLTELQYVTTILSRFDANVRTLQMNHDVQRENFMVSLSYTDFQRNMRVVSAVKSSPSLAKAATLAYIQICKYIGRFV